MHYLDLSKKKFELEKVFESVINKIPDLCHPATFRLENEDDFFNQTKDFKLEPFRNQEVFERSVTQTPDERRHDAVGSPTGDYLEVPRPQSCRVPAQSRNQPDSRQSGRKVVAFSGIGSIPNKPCVNGSRERKFQPERVSPQRQEALKKCLQRSDLNRRYSQIKLKKSADSCKDHWKESLDKIFIGDLAGRNANYPFANPMPACMLTEENIDNLRDIIVSSLDIEWRMLTPVRPTSEYEENYFDKLIQLQRSRYRCCQDLTTAASSLSRFSPPGSTLSPFKHTRHSFVVGNLTGQTSKRTPHDGRNKKSFCVDARLKSRFGAQRAKARSMAKSGGTNKVDIPMLMLTVDDKTDSQPLTAKDADEISVQSGKSGEGSSSGTQMGDDSGEFSYGHFSRFSKRNQRFARGQMSKTTNFDRADNSAPSDPPPTSDKTGEFQGDSLLDGQIADIMSGLLNVAV